MTSQLHVPDSVGKGLLCTQQVQGLAWLGLALRVTQGQDTYTLCRLSPSCTNLKKIAGSKMLDCGRPRDSSHFNIGKYKWDCTTFSLNLPLGLFALMMQAELLSMGFALWVSLNAGTEMESSAQDVSGVFLTSVLVQWQGKEWIWTKVNRAAVDNSLGQPHGELWS